VTVAAAVLGYLLGAVPSGLVVVRVLRGIDIRAYGSGNIGATNVFRLAGLPTAALVLLLDVLKGAIPVLLARAWGLSPVGVVLAGLAAVAGHDWSPFLRFRGGKGVATSLGALLVLSPAAAGAAVAVWIIVVAVTRYSSLGSLLGAASAPVVLWLGGEPREHMGFALAAVALIVYAHRGNIGRLLQGTESRVTDRREEATGPPRPRA